MNGKTCIARPVISPERGRRTMGVTVFGIRHHGPGCARSLRRALDELRPDVVVMEGPPDAERLLSWVAHGGLKPPVAILVYQVDEPRRAAYFPFAVFSPEWQTLAWAAHNKVPVRFMDLPQSHQLALEKLEEGDARKAEEERKARQEEAPASDSCRLPRPCPRPGGPIRWRSWPRPPATRTTSSGGKIRSSAVEMRRVCSRPSTKRCAASAPSFPKSGRGTSSARRTCAKRCGPLSRRAS